MAADECQTPPTLGVRTTKNDIRAEIRRLEWEQFQHPNDDAERARLNEIRALVESQLVDDSTSAAGNSREWVGTSRVDSGVRDDGTYEGTYPIWEDRTEEQDQLSAGLETSILRKLTGEQRVLYRMRYEAQMSIREIGAALHLSVEPIHRRLRNLHRDVRALLLAEYAPDAEVPAMVDDDAPVAPWEWDCPVALPEVEEPAYLDEPYVPVARGLVGHLSFGPAS